MKIVLVPVLCGLLFACGPVRELAVADIAGTRTVRLGPQNRPGGIFFAIRADGATYALHVTGSFNQWHPAQYALTNDPASGVWSGFVPLAQRGRIEYRFVRNGHEWLTDPLTDTVADGYGGGNSVFFASPGATSE